MTLRHVIAIIIFGLPLLIFVFRIWLWIYLRNRKSKLPIVDIPRPAGWSLQKRTDDLNEDISMSVLTLTISSVVGAVIYILGAHLLWASVMTMPFSIYALIKLLCLFPQYSRCSLGLMGEQAVGAVLNSISSNEVKVFHDFPVKERGKKPWNIDHVVVSADGVFVIETKARRKSRKNGKDGQEGYLVRYDGKLLHFPFSKEKRDLKQSKDNVTWITDYLTKAVGDPVSAKPVLVIAGWMVKREGRGQVDVLNEKELMNYFTGRKGEGLSSSMQRRICHQLGQKCKIDIG